MQVVQYLVAARVLLENKNDDVRCIWQVSTAWSKFVTTSNIGEGGGGLGSYAERAHYIYSYKEMVVPLGPYYGRCFYCMRFRPASLVDLEHNIIIVC